MNRVLLKKICLLFAAALLTTSCGLKGLLAELEESSREKVPLFPAETAGIHRDANDMAEECRIGVYAGQPVMKSFKQRILNPDHWIQYSGPAPDGTGKIYTLHLIQRVIPQKFGPDRTGTGYSFTLYTTDADIITECRVERHSVAY